MSVEAMAIVLHHSKAQGAALAVLIGIANHAGDGGAWPSVATLAKYGRCTERNVQKALHQLVGLGELAVHVQAGGTAAMKDHQRPNRYDVLLSCPSTCDRTANHRGIALPRAQSELWIEGVNPSSPGELQFTGGVNPSSPGGVNPSSPEPSIEPSLNTGSVGTHAQPARGSSDLTPSCTECSAPNLTVCASRQSKIAPEDRHHYSPRSAS